MPIAAIAIAAIGIPSLRAALGAVSAVTESATIYGHSRQGRPLIAYVLGDGPNVTLIGGGIHGNELAAPEVVEALRSFLKADPAALDGCRVILVPRVNPDGDAAHTRANARGVDLNRNFPYKWMPKRSGSRYSTGSEALSEPEAQDLVRLLDKYHPSKIVSVHWPLHTLVWVGPAGKELALAMQRENNYQFTDDVGYPTPGSFGSYCFHVRHIACVTLELPRQSASAAWTANKSALLTAIRFDAKANVEEPAAGSPPGR